MRVRVITLLILIVGLWSCKQQLNENSLVQLEMKQAKEKSYSASENILPKFNSVVSNWKEYNAFADFLAINYQKTNNQQALENAERLSNLSKNLKDSLLPQSINQVSLKARINLLYSETLRMYDMATIPTISDDSVHAQIEKVYVAFSALNAKINEMLEQKELQELYGELDPTKLKSASPTTESKKPVLKSKQKVDPNTTKLQLLDFNGKKQGKSKVKKTKKEIKQ